MPRTFLALAAALLLAALSAGPAAAAAQDTKLVLSGPAGQALRAAGVRIVAVAPAAASPKRIALPVESATIDGGKATVVHRGGLRLSAHGRIVELGSLTVRVGTASKLTARIAGGGRLTMPIDARRTRRTVAPDGTSITQSPIRLTKAAARLLRVRLGVKALTAGRLGTIDLDADATATVQIPGAPATPTVTGPPTPGGATISTRPATAVAIAGGTATWSPRASWLGYVSAGEGASGQAGATFATGTFTIPISGGWFDPPSGQAVVTTTGNTRFQFSTHGIDLVLADWTYDLAAPTPKAVAAVERSSADSGVRAGTRVPIALIKSAGIAPIVSPTTVTWTDVPLTLTSEGVPLYMAYLYDSDQGRLSISATLG
jgi:Htaa protein